MSKYNIEQKENNLYIVEATGNTKETVLKHYVDAYVKIVKGRKGINHYTIKGKSKTLKDVVRDFTNDIEDIEYNESTTASKAEEISITKTGNKFEYSSKIYTKTKNISQEEIKMRKLVHSETLFDFKDHEWRIKARLKKRNGE